LRELFYGSDFLVEPASLPCSCRQPLTAHGKLVLCFARDAIFARQVFGSACHVAAAIRVEQGDHEGIFELPLAKLESPSGSADDMRSLAHRFHASGKDNTRFAELNQLSCRNNRLDAGAAQPIDG